MTTADIGIPGLWIKDGVLYTDAPRQAVNAAARALREPHKMAEWKVDWWLGREVHKGPKVWRVTGSVPGPKFPMLVLTSLTHGDEIIKVSLPLANAALRRGDWTL